MKIGLRLILILGLFQVSCSDKNEGFLDLSIREINLNAGGTQQSVTVQTGNPLWYFSKETTWIIVERDGDILRIGAKANPTRNSRSANVVITSGDRYDRIIITQAGSSRAVGEPYPDAVNPIGIIYKMIDGEHGKVFSLDEKNDCAWASITGANETIRGYHDGKGNTRYMIDTYGSAPNFETLYPAFAWILEKNEGDPTGRWYIPAYYELVEMYYILTGNDYTIPETPPVGTLGVSIAHYFKAKEQFNFSLSTYGGTLFTYEGIYYWSSTEHNNNQARGVQFSSSTSSGALRNKVTVASSTVRAILEF